MAECSSDASKWACTCCTYLNYQNSIKCTVCLSARYDVDNGPLTIEDAAAGSYGSYDRDSVVAEADDGMIDEIDRTASAMCGMFINDQRWPCPTCTYLNCLRTKKCVQCYTDRPLRYSSDPALNVDFDQPERRQSPPAAHSAAAVDSTLLIAKALKKWPCQACTFMNWPNASRCTMCKEPKAQRPSLVLTIRSDTDYDDCDGWKRKLKRKKRISKS